MTTIAERQQIKEMLNYPPYASTVVEKQHMKAVLMYGIRKDLKYVWERLKEGTRRFLDMLCAYGAKRGFVYITGKSLAKLCQINERTVNRWIRVLIKSGHIVRVYRRAERSNGKGQPLFLFAHHPYFEHWTHFLKINEVDKERMEKGYFAKRRFG
ncbi:hypothetical protein BEH_25290 (plasmid) [Priestia filamentosa]|jgi:hypothetical protein|uniref:Uncharacterized protein n=1 Tax=Priestia filamentosa TaxID=1402861 RepID=A0A1X7GNI4_9BACI|nr:helix-turn-helix domain-containing protein [Priestia filamentosa]AVD54488.1 helix-turn-helix domain-containing protein [Priestia filamentosa]AWG44677.1 hypothetical protein BEH_25290 [Priestia filamentosa]OXS65062.1 helix-turn-helix domain-containing protein [Priestia filamentosa]SMF72433.1 Helix-turn-helix domain-containing protein [Priestia filamentosa]